MIGLQTETSSRHSFPARDGMRVPAVVFASQTLMPGDDKSLQQLRNVATLPGIVEAAYGMPDLHEGYGFPIGGVAATDIAHGGVVSPGGVGFDISCGVRLLASSISEQTLGVRRGRLMDRLGAVIPRGMGRGAVLSLKTRDQLEQILVGGSPKVVRWGYGTASDLENCEDTGVVGDADPEAVSPRALERGLGQVGSLGSGNHFLELQRVEVVYQPRVAEAFGLWPGQLCMMIHCGSRGLGHQICTDHVRTMMSAMPRYRITVPDDQLACAPVTSPEGRAYLGAMAAAANYGRANRQMLTHAARQAFDSVGGGQLELVYDVSHNLAKIETHVVDGQSLRLCVHRKGATRAFPPGHPELPPRYVEHGQPVLVPGSMGTASYVLTGVTPGAAFRSTCHGAGRVLSRHASARKISGSVLRHDMEAIGVTVRGASMRGLAEEAPFAYKDVDEVVRVCAENGLGALVARLAPVGVVKG